MLYRIYNSRLRRRSARSPKLYLPCATPRKFRIQLQQPTLVWTVLRLFRLCFLVFFKQQQILSRINKKQKNLWIKTRLPSVPYQVPHSTRKIHAWFYRAKQHSFSAILDSSKHMSFILSYSSIILLVRVYWFNRSNRDYGWKSKFFSLQCKSQKLFSEQTNYMLKISRRF